MRNTKAAKPLRTAMIVLGMHRTGTSAFARVASLLGCDLPHDLMQPNEGNDFGFWESNRVVALNDRLLFSAGSSWDDWLPLNEGWHQSPLRADYLMQAQEVLRQEYGDSSLFVLKDPRICRLAPFWLEATQDMGIHPVIILPQRNPYEVSASLQSRDDSAQGLGLLLWLRHVLEAEAATRGLPRFFFSYAKLLADWPSVVEGLEQATGLRFPGRSMNTEAQISSFLSDDARHERESSDVLGPTAPVWVRETYTIMERWCKAGETADDCAQLDEIRLSFDTAAPSFSRVIASGVAVGEGVGSAGRTRRELEQARAELEQARDDITALSQARDHDVSVVLQERNGELKHAQQELASLQAREREATRMRGEMETALQSRERELGAAQEALAAASGSRDDLERHLAEASANVERGEAEIATLGSALRQRQEEAAQAWAQLEAERQVCERIEAELQRANSQNERLIDSFATIEKRSRADLEELVKLRGRAGKARRAITQLTSEHERMLADSSRQEAELERARDIVVRGSAELAQLTMLYVQAQSRIQELEEAATMAGTLVEQSEEARRKRDEMLNQQQLEKAQLAQRLRSFEEADQRESALSQGQEAEIATLKISLANQLLQSDSLRKQAKWLQEVNAALQSKPTWWALLPADTRERYENALLEAKGLFDAASYLEKNPDVAVAAINPFVHYMEYGINEGRKW